MTRYCLRLLRCVFHIQLKMCFVCLVQTEKFILYKRHFSDVHRTRILDQISGTPNINFELKRQVIDG